MVPSLCPRNRVRYMRRQEQDAALDEGRRREVVKNRGRESPQMTSVIASPPGGGFCLTFRLRSAGSGSYRRNHA
jgi:hypothetical protein